MTYTANIPGIGTSTGTVTFRPGSILIAGPFGLGNPIQTTTGSAAIELTIESAMLDAGGNYVITASSGDHRGPAGQCQRSYRAYRALARSRFRLSRFQPDRRARPAGSCRGLPVAPRLHSACQPASHAVSVRQRCGNRVVPPASAFSARQTPPAEGVRRQVPANRVQLLAGRAGASGWCDRDFVQSRLE